MRLISAFAALMFASLAVAQDPQPIIIGAVNGSLAAPRVFVQMTGYKKFGSTLTEDYETRIYIQGQKFLIESYVDGTQKMQIVGDGARVWRYDPIKKEYSFLKLETWDLSKAFFTAAGWARTEAQRPIRLLAKSSNWLVNPLSRIVNDAFGEPVRIDLWQTTGTGPNWRGTIINFYLDPLNDRMDRVEIAEQIDVTTTVMHQAAYSIGFLYSDEPFKDSWFTFTPPAGSKPAADMPRRIGG